MVELGRLTVELPPPSPTMERWVELVDGVESVVSRATQNECARNGASDASDASDAHDGNGVERYFGSKEAKTIQPVQMYLRL